MDFLHVLSLSLLQGFTEFLPISSSAHLILLPTLTDWPDQGLAFDVAVHLGTLLAVLIYFRHDLIPLIRDWFLSIRNRQSTAHSRLAWAILWGTIPVGLVGLIGKDWIALNVRSPHIIAWATIGFGLLLGVAAWKSTRNPQPRDEYTLRIRDILIIGLAQALALIPGTSRSGITMTAALWLGLKPQAAARFSFLLAIPVITLSALLMAFDLSQSSHPVDWPSLVLGFALSAVVALISISAFIRLLDWTGFWPFVIYRLCLGSLLLIWMA
jgi:undecaprenyl-diphosphatase